MLTPIKFYIREHERFLVEVSTPLFFRSFFNPSYDLFADLNGVIACEILTLEPGIYQTNSFNADGYLENFSDWRAHNKLRYFDEDGQPSNAWGSKSLYGVADNVDQIKEYFKSVIDSDHNFVIFVTEIKGKDEPKSGGWRWHKWGEYIGTQNPQCEYIADEPEIESVLCFQGYFLAPITLISTW